jgi:hypothetical protein
MEANMKLLQWTAALALVLPFSTVAHADDVAYCQALAAKYQANLVKSSGHSPNPGTADGSVAADQCLHGNTAGIPVLERKLRDAKIELPARG